MSAVSTSVSVPGADGMSVPPSLSRPRVASGAIEWIDVLAWR
nr:hypothetical protein [Janibacter limosus]